MPPVEEIEQRWRAVLTPGLFAARRGDKAGGRLRDRIRTLPVMAILVVSLVWRQMPSLSEALWVVAREGLGDFCAFSGQPPSALATAAGALGPALCATL